VLSPFLDGYQFFLTYQIQFSQNKLQKVSILIFKFKTKNLYTESGYQYFKKKMFNQFSWCQNLIKFYHLAIFTNQLLLFFSQKKKTQKYQ
jgi:hypothetical protein